MNYLCITKPKSWHNANVRAWMNNCISNKQWISIIFHAQISLLNVTSQVDWIPTTHVTSWLMKMIKWIGDIFTYICVYDMNLSSSMREGDSLFHIFSELSRLLPYMLQTWQNISDIAAIYIWLSWWWLLQNTAVFGKLTTIFLSRMYYLILFEMMVLQSGCLGRTKSLPWLLIPWLQVTR